MKVAIYARVSTRDRGQDVRNQLEQLRTFAASQGWEVVHEFVDRASGKNADGRAEFRRLFEDASKRRFDLVLFWSLDRFSREGVLATLQHLERLQSYGVGYRSFTEQYLDSCGIFRDAVLSILAVIAKQERVRLSERVHAGLARARKEGRVGGRPKVVASHKRILELDEGGLTLREIAADVGCSHATVLRILRQHRAPGLAADEPALV